MSTQDKRDAALQRQVAFEKMVIIGLYILINNLIRQSNEVITWNKNAELWFKRFFEVEKLK
jgi:predicted methyltransferase